MKLDLAFPGRLEVVQHQRKEDSHVLSYLRSLTL